MVTEPRPCGDFAYIDTGDAKLFYRSLLDAFTASDGMQERHKIMARDVRGVYVEVRSWVPDCVSETRNDIFGGVAEASNQWIME